MDTSQLSADRRPPLWVLLFLMSAASAPAVIITPALSVIKSYFQVSQAQAQLVLSVFMLGYALGQFIYGPLANRLGRLGATYSGLSLAILGTLLCLVSSQFKLFEFLIAGRFIMALGAAVGVVVGMAMIADTHDQQQSRKAMSTLLIGFAFFPNVAIAIGGFCVTHISWNSIDYFILAYYLIVLLTLTRLTETLPCQARISIRPSQIIKGFIKVANNARYWALVLIVATGTGASYLFNGLAPVSALEDLHISADLYGSLSLIPAAGFFLGSLIARQLNQRYPAKRVILQGLSLLLMTSLGLILSVLFDGFNLMALFTAGFLFFLASRLIMSNAIMLALSETTDKANGAALMNGANLAITSTALFITGSLIHHSSLVLPTSLLAASTLGLLMLLLPKL